MLGLSASLSKASVTLLSFLKDNLKIFFDFKNTDLEFVGTGSTLFDGTNDQLAGTLTLSGDRSFAFWIKSTATTGNMRILHCETDSSEFINISMNAGEINMYDGTNNPETSPEYNDGIWHHVAITCATNNWTIYVDGVLVLNHTTWVNREASSDSFTIGEGTGANDFNGSLKNFAIWNRVLSASEVQNIMYKTYSDLQGTELTHLVSWYAMEESKDGDTSKMIDSKNPTTVGYDLSITNATVANFGASDVYGLDTPRKPRGVDNSKAAQADLIGSGSASFAQGVGDYIDCGTSSNFNFSTAAGASNDKAFSISAWIYKTEVGASSVIVSKSNASNTDFLFYTDASNNLGLALYTDTYTVNINGNGNTVLAINKWYHVASTYDGSGAMSGAKLYVNGVLETITTTTSGTYTGLNHESTTNLAIGNWLDVTNREFVGNLAQVGIWDTVLTQEQIQSISQKTYSELTANDGKDDLVSWWGLDSTIESSGTGANFVYDLNNTTLGSEELTNNGFESGLTLAAVWYAMDGWVDETLDSGQNANATLDTSNARTGSNCMKMELLSGTSYLNYGLTLAAGVYKFSLFAKVGASQTISNIRIGAATGVRGFTLGDSGTISSISENYQEFTVYINNPSSQNVRFTISAAGTNNHFLFIDDISIKKVNGNPGELL